jgi:hypothetical protein
MNLFLKTMMSAGLGVCIAVSGALIAGSAADAKEPAADKTQGKSKKDVKQIVFEEQKIEGKIRRPQMVLIKADQRPIFSSMGLVSLGRNDNIADFVDQSIIDKTPNQDAFQFDGTRISNYVK